MKNLLLIALLFWSAGIASATAYNTHQSGSWNVAATWTTGACGAATGPAVPVSGDTVTICTGHTVHDTAGATIGTSGIAGTTAVTLAGTGTLIIDSGITFTIKGDVDWQGGTLTCTSCTWKWLGPAGVRYQTKTSTATTKTFNFNSGTSTSDLSATGLAGMWELGGSSGIGVNLNITSSTFTNCGDASNACIGTSCGSFGCTSQVVTGNLFNAVGSVDLTSSGTGGTTQTHSNNTYINPIMARVYRVRNDTAPTTGSCTIANNVVYNGLTTGNTVNWWAKGCTAVTGNININTVTDRSQNTLSQGDSANAYLYWDGDLASVGQLDAPNTECAVVSSGNLYYTHADNPHTHGELGTGCSSTANSYTLSVADGDNYHKSDSGEFVVPFNAASETFNILINRQGQVFTAIHTTDRMTADHNTIFNSELGAVGETAGNAGQLVSYKNNLIAKPVDGFHESSFFVRQSTTTAPDYNAFYGMCGSGELGASACAADLNPPYLINTTLGITGYLQGAVQTVTNLVGKTATAGTTTTALVCTGCAFVTNAVQVGDWVVRTTGGAGTYTSGRVTAVTDETHIVMTAVTSLVSTDTFDIRTSYWNTSGLQYGQANVGLHDIHANPNFTDSTKSLCSWSNAVSGQSFNCNAQGGLVATAGTNATTIVCSTCTFQTWGITTSDTVAVGTTASTGIRGMSNVVSVDSQTQITIGSIASTTSGDIFSFITPVRNLARAMATLNGFDYTGAATTPSSTATVAAGLLYIRTAFTPRNTALSTAASDGTFIGAQLPVAGGCGFTILLGGVGCN